MRRTDEYAADEHGDKQHTTKVMEICMEKLLKKKCKDIYIQITHAYSRTQNKPTCTPAQIHTHSSSPPESEHLLFDYHGLANDTRESASLLNAAPSTIGEIRHLPHHIE